MVTFPLNVEKTLALKCPECGSDTGLLILWCGGAISAAVLLPGVHVIGHSLVRGLSQDFVSWPLPRLGH